MSSNFQVDNKELLKALGITQTSRTRSYNSFQNQTTIFQDSESGYELNRKDDTSTIASIHADSRNQGDRGYFLFSLDIDITEDKKDSLHVYSKDKPYDLARSFCHKHGITKEIVDIIANRIIENAKEALKSQENSCQVYLAEVEGGSIENSVLEDELLQENNQVPPKHGDDSVDEIMSPIINQKPRVMLEKDLNTEFEPRNILTEAKENNSLGFYFHFDEPNDDLGLSNDKSNNDFTPRYGDENRSPKETVKRNQNRKTSESRFYEKAMRDIENRVSNRIRDAQIREVFNQERHKECSFHPTINENSLKLAAKRRGNIDVGNLLLLKGKITEERRIQLKQEIRLQETLKNTFKPDINTKSKYIDGINRPNYEPNQRFEDLYQEYRIFHEKRNQLKARVSREYSFLPNISNQKNKNKPEKENVSFLERFREDLSKRKTRKTNDEEAALKSKPNFRPKILNKSFDGSRNQEKLPIGEYLYKMALEIEGKKTELKEAYYKELRDKAPKCIGKSVKIIQTKIKKSLQLIFKRLDADNDGVISGDNLNTNLIPNKVNKILSPLFEELIQSKSQQSFSQFSEAALKIMKKADYIATSELIFEISKIDEQERNKNSQEKNYGTKLLFQPEINSKSKKLVSNEKRGRSVYQRLFTEMARSEIRLNVLKEKITKKELKECSFRPEINHFGGKTELFYARIFGKLDVSF